MATLTAPPDATTTEWPGHGIGISNVDTRTRDHAPKRTGDRDALRTLAQRALEGKHAFIEDAIYHGLRVRLFTNSHHLADFWRDHVFSPADWLEHTGLRAGGVDATVYAVIGVGEVEEGVYDFPDRNETYLFNTSWFGELREGAQAAVSRILRAKGLLVFNGSAVEIDGRGLLCLGGAGTGRSATALALAERGAALVADDAVCVEIGKSQNPMAYRLEKGLYLPTKLVTAFPQFEPILLNGKFENVPNDAGNRMTAYDGSRTMILPSKLVGRRKVKGPNRPVPVHAVAYLRRDPKDDTVLSPSRKQDFPAPAYDLNGVLTGRDGLVAIAKILERVTKLTPRDARVTVNDHSKFTESP